MPWNYFFSALIGLAAGILVTVLVGNRSWKQRFHRLRDENERLQQNAAFNQRAVIYLHELQDQYSREKQAHTAQLETLQTRISALEALMTELEAGKHPLRIDPDDIPVSESTQAKTGTPTDNLQKIKGVGPVLAEKLNQAGIFTFTQLAASNVEYLHAALDKSSVRLANIDAIITQAHRLAGIETGANGSKPAPQNDPIGL